MLTCSGHWLWFSERHNTLIYLVLIYIPPRPCSQAAENRSSACRRPCSMDASNTKSFAESKRLILRFPAMTPTSTRLFIHIIYSTFSKGVFIAHTPVEIQHPQWKAVFYRRWNGRKVMCKNAVNYFKVYFGRLQQLAAGWSLKFNSCRGDWGERSCPRVATAFHSLARIRIPSKFGPSKFGKKILY